MVIQHQRNPPPTLVTTDEPMNRAHTKSPSVFFLKKRRPHQISCPFLIRSETSESYTTRHQSQRIAQAGIEHLRFRIVTDDASPASRLISHHATASPPPQAGATREQTTESSSATSTTGHAESAGTAKERNGTTTQRKKRIKKPCRWSPCGDPGCSLNGFEKSKL
jgi:hypothetical protein